MSLSEALELFKLVAEMRADSGSNPLLWEAHLHADFIGPFPNHRRNFYLTISRNHSAEVSEDWGPVIKLCEERDLIVSPAEVGKLYIVSPAEVGKLLIRKEAP